MATPKINGRKSVTCGGAFGSAGTEDGIGVSPAKNELKKVKVHIADEHPIVIHGWAHLLNHQHDMEYCGASDSVSGVRSAVEGARPDLLVMELRLKGGDGLDLIKDLRLQQPSLFILVVTQLDEAFYAERALRAGASGFIHKSQPLKELLAATRVVIAGEIYVSQRLRATILRQALERKPHWSNGEYAQLSDRELQIFCRIGAGISSRLIAVELKISLKTVETHRENIKHKLGLNGAAELASCATQFVHDGDVSFQAG